jgi:prepilin-type N-terminal cleavage/methylation domain-containing protein
MVIKIRHGRSGFTLVELLVVIIIVALLSALTLGALRTGGIRAKEDSARSFVVHISDSLMELFEELDDQGFTRDEVGPSYAVRWQIPVTRFDALYPSGGNPIAPFGSTYRSYAQSMSAGSATESAECLYMIMTQTGYFADFVETLHATQVADTDGNGLNEFIDPWGTPIRLDFSPADPPGEDLNNNNILDVGEDVNGNGLLDKSAVLTIRNLPVIRSAGVDQVFGFFDEDINANGVLDSGEDLNQNNQLDALGDDVVSVDLASGIFAQ